MKPQKLTYIQVKEAIISSLSPDLLGPQWLAQYSADDPPETGHCAVATEAFYYLAGGREAGFIPVVCGYDSDGKGGRYFGAARGTREDTRQATHWWTRGPANGQRGKGRIFDVTVGQYSGPFPYEHGRNVGFMQPQKKPSKRAQIVMDRVVGKLGQDALEAYKQENIRSFRARRQTVPSIKNTL